MNAEITKPFVFNYFAGKASALQKQMIDEWVKNPTHQELFYQWLEEYETQHPQYITDTTAALERFRDFAQQRATYPHHSSFQKSQNFYSSKRYNWWWAAAAVAMLILGTWLLRDTILYRTYSTRFGQTQQLTLSDGTQVVLNANSSLTVPRFGFGAKTREVFLQGEANFSVTHQANNQRFVVKTEKEVEVVVLGTEFTVYARQQNAKVILNKGKVQLRYREGQTQKQLTMRPGDLVTFDQRNRATKEVTTLPEKYTAWKDHRFVFDDTSLQEFAQIIEETYGLKIIVADPQLARRTLVGSFRADNADELLTTVAELFNLQIIKTNDVIILAQKSNSPN
ncbi:MAG: FecR family protein [Runella sp.]